MDTTRENVDRLGFPAWADNEIMNFIEDWKDTILISDGNMTIERNDACNIHCTFKDKQATVRVRAYVIYSGWQTHERNIEVK